MSEVEYKTRIRINIATSVKGVKTYDATVEMIDTDMYAVLQESDLLIKELDARYPIEK